MGAVQIVVLHLMNEIRNKQKLIIQQIHGKVSYEIYC